MITYRKEDLSNPTVKNIIVSTINDAVKGGFIRLNKFQSKGGHGEIQNATYCKGINYKTAVSRSLEMLNQMESDNSISFEIKRGTYQNNNGEQNPTNRKSKAFPNPVVVTELVKSGDPDLQEAFAKVRKSLTDPQPVYKEYSKLGNGVYEDETGTLYIRDLRLVQKSILVKGDYPFKASSKINSLVAAIKKDMPVGKYRMVRMDGDFESIALGGEKLMEDENIVA